MERNQFVFGLQVGSRRVDFLVDDAVSVELKAITLLEDVHLAQAINYLEAYDLEVGLLINFLEFKRVTNRKFRQKNQGNQEIKGITVQTNHRE